MADIQTIGVLGYENCSEQDTITPIEIFRGAAMVVSQQIKTLLTNARVAKLGVKLVALGKGNINMQMGTEVVPDGLLDDQQLFDLFYVPGGVGSGETTRNDKVLQAIRRHHQGGKAAASSSGSSFSPPPPTT